MDLSASPAPIPNHPGLIDLVRSSALVNLRLSLSLLGSKVKSKLTFEVNLLDGLPDALLLALEVRDGGVLELEPELLVLAQGQLLGPGMERSRCHHNKDLHLGPRWTQPPRRPKRARSFISIYLKIFKYSLSSGAVKVSCGRETLLRLV